MVREVRNVRLPQLEPELPLELFPQPQYFGLVLRVQQRDDPVADAFLLSNARCASWVPMLFRDLGNAPHHILPFLARDRTGQ